MSKKKDRKLLRPPAPSQRLLEGLSDAESLIGKKQWDAAYEVLEDLQRRYPNDADVLGMLLEVSYERRDMEGYQQACQELLRIDPTDPELTLSLAGAYLNNRHIALALRTFQDFAKRWPEHEQIAEVQNMIAMLREGLVQQIASEGGEEAASLQFAIQHDEMQVLMHQGKYLQAIALGEKIIRAYPGFISTYNNLSQMHWMEGHLAKAEEYARRALDFKAENVYALGNMIRYALAAGRVDAAQKYGRRLVTSTPPAFDRSVKIAETLVLLGDDLGILDALRQAQESKEIEPVGEGAAVLYHLAGAAALSLGQEAQARQLWQQALQASPGFELARDNLADLRKPSHERHAPWFYRFNEWLPFRTVEEFFLKMDEVIASKNEAHIERALQRFVQKHPELGHLAPLMLARGDEHCRQLVLQFASVSQDAKLLQAVKDFALGQHGPDRMRLEASRIASLAGALPSEMVRMWIQGKWSDMLITNITVNDDEA